MFLLLQVNEAVTQLREVTIERDNYYGKNC